MSAKGEVGIAVVPAGSTIWPPVAAVACSALSSLVKVAGSMACCGSCVAVAFAPNEAGILLVAAFTNCSVNGAEELYSCGWTSGLFAGFSCFNPSIRFPNPPAGFSCPICVIFGCATLLCAVIGFSTPGSVSEIVVVAGISGDDCSNNGAAPSGAFSGLRPPIAERGLYDASARASVLGKRIGIRLGE